MFSVVFFLALASKVKEMLVAIDRSAQGAPGSSGLCRFLRCAFTQARRGRGTEVYISLHRAIISIHVEKYIYFRHELNLNVSHST